MRLENDFRALAYLLGIAASMLIVLPGFRPSGLPIAYLLPICLLIIFPFAGVRVFKSRLGKSVFIVWAVPVIYLLLHILILQSGNFIQYLSRNGMGYLGGVLIFSMATNYRIMGRVILGMMPIMILDSLAGIGQFFSFGAAFDISKWVASYSQITDYQIAYQLTLTRIFGLHSLPHGFAYDQGVWAIILFSYMLVTKQRLFQILLMCVFSVTLLAVFLSSQRSIVWVLVPSIAVIYIMAKGITRGGIVFGVIICAMLLFDFGDFLSSENAEINRLSVVSNNADKDRMKGWIAAVKVIADDPFIGTAYEEGRYAIHNGLLNGWAHFGIVWGLGFLFGFVYCIVKFFRYKISRTWVRFVPIAMLAVIFSNSMFHTLTPARNDITFFLVLGFMVAFLISERSRDISANSNGRIVSYA